MQVDAAHSNRNSFLFLSYLTKKLLCVQNLIVIIICSY